MVKQIRNKGITKKNKNKPKRISGVSPKVRKRITGVLKQIAEEAKKPSRDRKSMYKILKENGYSDSMASKPRQVLGSKTAIDFMKKYIPDEKIYRTHGELMEASQIQHYVFPKVRRGKNNVKDMTDKEIEKLINAMPGCKLIYIKRDPYVGAVAYFTSPENRSRKDAVDMAYKLKGRYAPDKVELSKRKFEDLSNAELAALIKKTRDFLTKK